MNMPSNSQKTIPIYLFLALLAGCTHFRPADFPSTRDGVMVHLDEEATKECPESAVTRSCLCFTAENRSGKPVQGLQLVIFGAQPNAFQRCEADPPLFTRLGVNHFTMGKIPPGHSRTECYHGGFGRECNVNYSSVGILKMSFEREIVRPLPIDENKQSSASEISP